jgi:hypothetical protein
MVGWSATGVNKGRGSIPRAAGGTAAGCNSPWEVLGFKQGRPRRVVPTRQKQLTAVKALQRHTPVREAESCAVSGTPAGVSLI